MSLFSQTDDIYWEVSSPVLLHFKYIFNPHLKTCFSLLSERKKNIDVREKHRLVAFVHVPWQGIEPATWVCPVPGIQSATLWSVRWCSNHVSHNGQAHFNHFKKNDFIYLFLDGGESREKERERNINWLPLAPAPIEGPAPQPRHVPWLGMEPVTFRFAGWCLTNWATPPIRVIFTCTVH